MVTSNCELLNLFAVVDSTRFAMQQRADNQKTDGRPVEGALNSK
jgi:hypothetical protein